MTPQDPAQEAGSGAEEPTAAVGTGRRGQQLVCEGWFASHADSGTPGPHVHLRTSDGQDPVLRTDQVPAFVDALTRVAERIDRLWATDGEDYARDVVLRAPDPQDPGVIRGNHLDHLRFVQRVADNLPEVARLLARAESTDEALVDLGALLDVEEAEVMYRLARFDLLALTRAAYDRRARLLADPDEDVVT